MADNNVLFENKVYSQGVDIYWPSFGDGPYIIQKNQTGRDEDLYPKLLDNKGIPKMFNCIPGEPLYLYNDEETDIRNSYLRMIKNRQYDLALSRKVVVDENYPEYVEYYRPFRRFTRKRELATMLGEYQLIFGRRCLVEQIKICRYSFAWPEIREILLHDRSFRMKNAAKWVLQSFPYEIAQSIANDVVKYLKGKLNTSFVLDIANFFPSETMVAPLEEMFVDNYFYRPNDEMYVVEVYGNHTVQAEILKVCEKIPSVRALRLLEAGVAHPFVYIEQQALDSIKRWVKNTAWFLSREKKYNLELAKEIREVFRKYDICAYKNSSHILRKKLKLLG